MTDDQGTPGSARPAEPSQLFRFCPRCGAGCAPGGNPFDCPACHFHYFFNPSCAAAAYIFDAEGRTLFVERAQEPEKGKLAIPGGFIDIGEPAEDALRREVREEVGLEIENVAFLTSCPNFYPYRGVTYPVCDMVFTAAVVNPEAVQSLDGVKSYTWRRPADVTPEELAFPSLRKGLELLKGR